MTDAVPEKRWVKYFKKVKAFFSTIFNWLGRFFSSWKKTTVSSETRSKSTNDEEPILNVPNNFSISKPPSSQPLTHLSEKKIQNIPQAVLNQVISPYLQPHEVNEWKQTNKTLCQSIHLTSKHRAIVEQKHRLNIENIEKFYPQLIIDAIGLEKIIKFPVVRYKEALYIIEEESDDDYGYARFYIYNTVHQSLLENHKAIRGVDNNGIPFISYALNINNKQEIITIFKHPKNTWKMTSTADSLNERCQPTFSSQPSLREVALLLKQDFNSINLELKKTPPSQPV